MTCQYKFHNPLNFLMSETNFGIRHKSCARNLLTLLAIWHPYLCPGCTMQRQSSFCTWVKHNQNARSNHSSHVAPQLSFMDAYKCIAHIGMDKLQHMHLANQMEGLNIGLWAVLHVISVSKQTWNIFHLLHMSPGYQQDSNVSTPTLLAHCQSPSKSMHTFSWSGMITRIWLDHHLAIQKLCRINPNLLWQHLYHSV